MRESASDTHYCFKCKLKRVLSGYYTYTCPNCGKTTYRLIGESNFIECVWTLKTSVHSRRRWFKSFGLRYTNFDNANLLTVDFIEVVSVIEKQRLTPGKNISHYGYYLIRLASRRNIRLKKEPNDIKIRGKNKAIFYCQLFGVVYKALGWDKIRTNCSYYREYRQNSRFMIKEILSRQ